MPDFYLAKLGHAGVYIFFLFFAPKHGLWVLVGGGSIFVLSKNKKNIIFFFSAEKFQLLKLKKGNLFIAWASFRYQTGDFLHQSPPILGFSNSTDFHFISRPLQFNWLQFKPTYKSGCITAFLLHLTSLFYYHVVAYKQNCLWFLDI